MIQKDETICYCFNFTRVDIQKDIKKNGQSLIIKKNMREKRQSYLLTYGRKKISGM